MKEYHKRAHAIRVEGDIDAICLAFNRGRQEGDGHVWHNGGHVFSTFTTSRVFLSHKDGGCEVAHAGDWIVAYPDGKVAKLTDAQFNAEFLPMTD